MEEVVFLLRWNVSRSSFFKTSATTVIHSYDFNFHLYNLLRSFNKSSYFTKVINTWKDKFRREEMDLFGDMLRLTRLCLISTTNLVQTTISHPPPCYIFTSIASKCFLHKEVNLMFIKSIPNIFLWGLSCWFSSEKSTLQCKGCRFDLLSKN